MGDQVGHSPLSRGQTSHHRRGQQSHRLEAATVEPRCILGCHHQQATQKDQGQTSDPGQGPGMVELVNWPGASATSGSHHPASQAPASRAKARVSVP